MNISAEITDPLDTIWVGDMLNRRKDAETIHQFTLGHLDLRERAGQDRTYVLNLDADWGAGKTFFLERLKKHLEHHNHVAVYVNAWEDDYSDDPFLTVVDAIQGALTAKLKSQSYTNEQVKDKLRPLAKSATKVAGNALLSGGKHFLARYIGNEAIKEVGVLWKEEEDWEDGSDLDEAIQKAITSAIDTTGAELLNNFKLQRKAQLGFKQTLSDIANEVLGSENVDAPIFVLIDELDRSRPTYAIELLERVKHIFSLNNFVFILGTDTKQLGHAVRGVYGQGFDGPRYLRRFIDRTYSFQQVETRDFVQYKLNRLGLSEDQFTVPKPFSVVGYISNVLDSDERSLRDIDQMLDIVATFVALWPYEDLSIDMVTLLHLVYLQHQDKKDDEFDDHPLAEVKLNFDQYVGNRPVSYTYYHVYQAASGKLEPKLKEIENSWHEWLFSKTKDEEKVYRKTNKNRPRPFTTRQEYKDMLKQVTAIQDE